MVTEKSYEVRLRRAAARQGLTLRKSFRRDPRAYDYGAYWLVNGEGVVVRGHPKIGTTLADIENYLLGKS
jgi:hypothetical protein